MGEDEPRAVAAFVTVVVATSGAFWVLGAVETGQLLLPGLPVSALMFVAPTIGVVVALGPRALIRTVVARSAARRDALRRLGRSLCWLPLMPAVVVATYPLQVWADRNLPAFTVDVSTAAVLLLVFLVTATFEELGWTWLLTARLLRRHRPLWTGLFVGALWAGVHTVPYLQAGNPISWVVWQCLFTIVFRVVLVLAYCLSGRSLAVAVVMHATYNVAWGLYPVDGSHYSPMYTAALTAAVAVTLAVHSRLRPVNRPV